jgi:hypothetical protein
VELFTRFFRETLGQSETASLLPPANRTSSLDHQSLDPLELLEPSFIFPESEDDWAAHLTRRHLTRDGLNAADLSVSGATIFSWGSKEESPGRLAPPGDILHLLGVVTFLNETGERHFDPFDALRLTLPEQLASMTPDAQGRILLRYPALMKELDYSHFRLGALLRSHIRASGAHDMDLARQWEVSDSTVFEYRRGVVRKMRMDTLERLADSLSSTPDQRREMMNLLMFLRYRPYFDASMVITDGDGTPLNGRPALPSRFQIVLVPHEESLKPLDTARRVRFEREPFASALNGMVDLSLDLLGPGPNLNWRVQNTSSLETKRFLSMIIPNASNELVRVTPTTFNFSADKAKTPGWCARARSVRSAIFTGNFSDFLKGFIFTPAPAVKSLLAKAPFVLKSFPPRRSKPKG